MEKNIKIKNFLRGIRTYSFYGKQLSRLRSGQHYYMLFTSTMNTISLLKLAFNLTFFTVFLLTPILLLFGFIIGYIVDIKNINSTDILKTNEVVHRYLNTNDIKNQEFQNLQLETIVESLISIQNNKPIDINIIHRKYSDYKNKWEFKKVL